MESERNDKDKRSPFSLPILSLCFLSPELASPALSVLIYKCCNHSKNIALLYDVQTPETSKTHSVFKGCSVNTAIINLQITMFFTLVLFHYVFFFFLGGGMDIYKTKLCIWCAIVIVHFL